MILQEILKEAHNWFEKIKEQYSNKLKIKVITDRENLYQIDFEAENCLANLTVGEPDFAPYSHVSFEVAAMINDKEPSLVYYWYDNETHTVQDIIDNLDKGIQFMINY